MTLRPLGPLAAADLVQPTERVAHDLRGLRPQCIEALRRVRLMRLFGETPTSVGPDLEIEAGNAGELAHIGGDDRQPMGHASRGQPNIVRPDECTSLA